MVLSSTLITPLPVNTVPSKLAPKVPNNVSRKPPFCYFASFLIVFVINNPDSSSDLMIFVISFIFSFEIINVALREAKSEGRPDP